MVLVAILAGCSPSAATEPRVSPTPNAFASPSPRPTSSPAPAAVDYGPVPNLPVFYAGDPQIASWLVAFDWSGRPVGTLKLDAQPNAGVAAAPGGGTVYVDGRFYDRGGRLVGSLPVTDKATPTWDEDGRHVCGLRGSSDINASFRYELWTDAVGNAPRDVAAVGPETMLGQTGENVIACSVRRDLAIVVRTAIAWPTDAWFVRLSDGALLGHRSYPNQALSNIVASRDARYLAENATGEPSGAAATVVRDVDTGAVVGRFGPDSVLGFAANNAAVLLSLGSAHAVAVATLAGAMSTPISIDGQPLFAVARPGSADFALFLQVSDSVDAVELVRASGAAMPISGSYRAGVLG